MDPILAQIMLFAGNFPPRGWAFCDGQALSVQNNAALYSILGITYGGDGKTNFCLPDLRSRVPVGRGASPGLSRYEIGQKGGQETCTLNVNQMPSHSHQIVVGSMAGETASGGSVGTAPANGASLVPTAVSGAGQPHENRQPYLAMNYIIAIEGNYPMKAD
jgi:microcystin-dependent protein